MRVLRSLSILMVALVAVGTVSLPAAVAGSSPFAKGGEPTCTVLVTSPSSSTTTCSGTLSSGMGGQDESASLDVDGSAAYRCQDATGATVPGQIVKGGTGTQTTFLTSKKSTRFTTVPTDLTAQTILTGTGSGCADGSTVVDLTLSTTRITLWISAPGDGTILVCTAADPDGLSGTVALTC
ncbi:MAG TPA: hypothetical protein VGK78_07820 [Nocardioides sp.]|uniref:hypothetical protein n=1 Tax=Nocardioides sp. TaxID=35761 RepID=UPI002F3EE407